MRRDTVIVARVLNRSTDETRLVAGYAPAGDQRAREQTSPRPLGSCRLSMIAFRLLYALAWADRSHLLPAVATSSPTANSARRCSGKAESGSANIGKTRPV